MTDFINLTVAVPTQRLADFHFAHARWLEQPDLGEDDALPGGPGAPADDVMTEWGSGTGDEAAAKLLWEKLSPTAQAILEILMAEPGREYSGDQLAERLGIKNGKYGVAGTLAWPGRYSYAMQRKHPVRYREASDGHARYHVEPAAAELFRAAAVEGPA